MSRPKNCINWSLVSLVLLLRNARVSLISWKILAKMDNESTVEPELYSIMVFVSDVTHCDSIFRAERVSCFEKSFEELVSASDLEALSHCALGA